MTLIKRLTILSIYSDHNIKHFTAMKTSQYKTGQYVVGWFNNIVKLGEPIVLESGEDGFETDFRIGGTNQRITLESIQRLCTEEEINEYKEKYNA